MADGAVAAFGAWDNFYVIVGSSAAALTGLQFVVMALVSDAGGQGDERSVLAFGSPTVVHFCAVLLVSAILSVPWPSLASAGAALEITGAAGVGYAVIVTVRAARQTVYKPVFEDWVWHVALPLAAYGGVAVAAPLLPSGPVGALFAFGAAALVLLFTGIHNAWDTVTYMTLEQMRRRHERERRGGDSNPR